MIPSKRPIQKCSAALGAVLCVFLAAPCLKALYAKEKEWRASPGPAAIHAFQAGETLTYDVTWSKVMKAGKTVMEVTEERTVKGRQAFRFAMSSRTRGALNKLYPLGDRVQSVFDPEHMQSLSYHLDAQRGKKKRSREMRFDPGKRTVVSKLNQEPARTVDVPERVQDPLSAIYALRTREHLAVGMPFHIDVFDGNRQWAVEIRVLGRETVKTPAGEFSTVRVSASQGMLATEGEVLLWLTDDVRKVPVRIQSKLSFGSMVFTLREMRL